MTDLLPFLRLYRQHWLSLSLGLLLALVTLVAGMGLLSLRLVPLRRRRGGDGGRQSRHLQLHDAGWRVRFFSSSAPPAAGVSGW